MELLNFLFLISDERKKTLSSPENSPPERITLFSSLNMVLGTSDKSSNHKGCHFGGQDGGVTEKQNYSGSCN